jgi:hypothetical protein
MKIRFLAKVAHKNSAAKIEQASLKLFKPYKLKVRLYVNKSDFFEVEIQDGDQSFDEFCNDLGYVVSRDYFENMTAIEEMYEFLKTAQVEHAPAVNYCDMSPAAVLARAILQEYPHCSASEFKRLAAIEAIDRGYDQSIAMQAINYYA